MSEHRTVVVVGGGQAGLSMSWCLSERGIDHVVLEKHSVGHEWRERRWDSFCLVTPNWQCTLPGFPYSGPDPDGFMVRDEIVAYLEAYRASFGPPLLEGCAVQEVRRGGAAAFEVESDAGTFTADEVVVATGGYHTAKVPRLAERFPDDVLQLHSSAYKRADALPDGAVLVVGTGQSGCQIAEDLHLEGREVHLALGSAPRTARFYRGKDVTWWLDRMGHYDMPVGEHPSGDAVRLKANHYVKGRGGGRDIDLRVFAQEGMRLHGRLQGVDGTALAFGDDLRKNLDGADASNEAIKQQIDQWIEAQGFDAPAEAAYVAPWEPAEEQPRELDLRAAGITTVIWSMGYAADFSWVAVPVFDGRGYPTHVRGETSETGLSFLGLPWMHTWGSGRFSGVARDAGHLADRIAERVPADVVAA